MSLRPATLADLRALVPAGMHRRAWQAYQVQFERSHVWASEDDQGLAAVGGAYPDHDAGEFETWLHVRTHPRVRVKTLCLDVAIALNSIPEGWPVVAWVDSRVPKNLRFATFLGFKPFHFASDDRIAPSILKLIRKG